MRCTKMMGGGFCGTILAGFLLLGGGQLAHGARLLEVQIEQDGKAVLKTLLTDGSEPDLGVVWNMLREASFEPVGEFTVDPADPSRATLKGKIRIAITHTKSVLQSAGGDVRTEAFVDELQLVRPSADGDRWTLAPGEVERTAKAAGIGLPKQQHWLSDNKWVLIGVAGMIVVVAMLWLVLRR